MGCSSYCSWTLIDKHQATMTCDLAHSRGKQSDYVLSPTTTHDQESASPETSAVYSTVPNRNVDSSGAGI